MNGITEVLVMKTRVGFVIPKTCQIHQDLPHSPEYSNVEMTSLCSSVSCADKKASSLGHTYPTCQSCLQCSRIISRGQLIDMVFINSMHLYVEIIQKELCECFHFIMHEIITLHPYTCSAYKNPFYFHILWLCAIFVYYKCLLKRVFNTRLESVLAIKHIVVMQSKAITNSSYEYIMIICPSFS